MRQAISEQVETIVETVRIALEQTPPELAADIVDRGIVLTGGGSLLKNLDVLLREETKLPITVAEDPLSAVVVGSGRALDNLAILKEVTIREVNSGLSIERFRWISSQSGSGSASSDSYCPLLSSNFGHDRHWNLGEAVAVEVTAPIQSGRAGRR